VGANSDDIYFIVKGDIKNNLTERIVKGGTMIGEVDVFLKRRRIETFTT
jgi:CRP-like cAMP-binding protein